MKFLHPLLLATGVLSAPAAATPIAIEHVTMIDGTGAPVSYATILINGGRIIAAGRRVAVPRGARRFDDRG